MRPKLFARASNQTGLSVPATIVTMCLAVCVGLSAGGAAGQPAAEKPADAPKKHRHPKKPPEAAPAPDKPEAAGKPASPAAPSQGEAATPAAADDAMVEQLAKVGVKTCLGAITGLGKKTLGGVANYGRAANWHKTAPNDRLASLLLAQSYPAGAPLPSALAFMFAAPVGKTTTCDAYAVQVIPTTEKCSAIQTKISIRGKKLGDLSGVPVLNDANGSEIMLLPSAGGGCVLVALRVDYGP